MTPRHFVDLCRRWLARGPAPLGLLGLALLALALFAAPETDAATSRRHYLPIIPRDSTPTPTFTPIPTATPTPDPVCPVTGQSYDLIPTDGRYSGHAPNVSPDLNLTIRGWVTVDEARGLVDYNGGTDSGAPQLYSLFANDRTPAFSSTHRVYDWDWTNNRRGNVLTTWPVTLLGMATTPGEAIRLPRRNGSDIYQGTYYGLVVYAEKTRISLHYGRNDYIAPGYGIHIENVCVDPNLLARYEQGNAGGRFQLPGLRNNQVLGTARGAEVLVAIRDTGTFMDPRSRKDWWMGRAAQFVADGGTTHTTGAGGTTPTPTPSP
jgi:hypothetical protein